MANQPQIKRICSICGIEKPIVAFLQITGKQGTVYGTVCASCRAMERKQSTSPPDEDHSTASTEGRIGAKEKAQIDQKKYTQLKELKELYIKEAKKQAEKNIVKTEEKDLKQKAELKHRTYIETKQIQSFLNQGRADHPKDNVAERDVKQQEQTRNLQENQQQQVVRQEDIVKQEIQMTSVDFSKPVVQGQTTQLRFQSDTFKKFKSWLGIKDINSPIMETLDALHAKTSLQTKGSMFENKSSDPKEEIEKYIEKRLDQPSGSRRR